MHEIKEKYLFYNECFRITSIDIYSNKNTDIASLSPIKQESLNEPLCLELDYYHTLFQKYMDEIVYATRR